MHHGWLEAGRTARLLDWEDWLPGGCDVPEAAETWDDTKHDLTTKLPGAPDPIATYSVPYLGTW